MQLAVYTVAANHTSRYKPQMDGMHCNIDKNIRLKYSQKQNPESRLINDLSSKCDVLYVLCTELSLPLYFKVKYHTIIIYNILCVCVCVNVCLCECVFPGA